MDILLIKPLLLLLLLLLLQVKPEITIYNYISHKKVEKENDSRKG